MIEVSEEYKKAVYAPIRACKARITFEILDVEAHKDNTKIVTGEASISRKEQLTNKIRETTLKYATFEPDYFKLDGSFHIPPKATEGDAELGWWSEALGDISGNFSPYQVIEFKFSKDHSSMGLTIAFDILNNEYASNFDIDVFGSAGNLVVHEVITNNFDSKYMLISQLSNYTRIVITIKKWSKAYRRAKVVEVDFGVIKQYEDDKIIKINLVEQMNIISNNLPSNELKFTVDNSDKAFNILNPQGFYKYFQEEQEAITEIGVMLEDGSFEYIPVGKTYLKEWQTDEGSLTTTLTTRDIIDRLGKGKYVGATIGEKSLYDLATDILTKANVDYDIDEGLKSIKTSGYLGIVTFREAIQCLAIAGKCAVYQDRITNKLVIKQFKTLDASSSYLYFCGADMFCGMLTPQTDNGFDMKQIDLDNVYSDPKIKLDKLVKAVDIVMNTYTKDSESKEIIDTTLCINGEETVFIEFKNKIQSTAAFTIVGATTWSVNNCYANGAYLKIKANGSVNIKANGSELKIQKTTFTLVDSSVKEGITLKIDNSLVDSVEVAKDVAEWVFSESKLRAIYDVNWRQNPALECGDIVIIEDAFGEKKQSRITKQVFEYQGYLSGKTESKGGV